MVISNLEWMIIFIIVIGIVILLTIKLNEVPINKDNMVNIACFKCGATENLVRVAFNDANGHIIGYVLSCKKCFNEVRNGKIYVFTDKEKEEAEKLAEESDTKPDLRSIQTCQWYQ